ncbi:MAG: signal peptidase I [Verrucomicrobiota bacterium]
MKDIVFGFLGRQWKEWRGTVFFVLFVLVPVKSSLADWNWVPTGSMNPTILEGDLVYVDKLAYDLRVPLTFKRVAEWGDPKRGDIVVCFSPEDGIRLVKRVVGLPGDRLEMRNNLLYVNGERVPYAELNDEATLGLEDELIAEAVFAEEYLGDRSHAVMALPRVVTDRRDFPEIEVPEGKYFMMGDNRDVSHDSRAYGFIDRAKIIGEAKKVLVSFNILDWYQPRFERFWIDLK